MYTGVPVLLCDFHREQAWVRWFNDSTHGCGDIKEEVLSHLRGIAYSRTESEMKGRIDNMMMKPWWRKRKRLRKYISNSYLKIKEVISLSIHIISDFFLISVDGMVKS